MSLLRGLSKGKAFSRTTLGAIMITWKMHVSTPDLFLPLLHHTPYCFEASPLLAAATCKTSQFFTTTGFRRIVSVCDPAPGTSTSRACRPQSLQRAAGQRCSAFNDYWQWSWILNMEYKWMFNGVEFYWKKSIGLSLFKWPPVNGALSHQLLHLQVRFARGKY